jgi:hypothetical protein
LKFKKCHENFRQQAKTEKTTFNLLLLDKKDLFAGFSFAAAALLGPRMLACFADYLFDKFNECKTATVSDPYKNRPDPQR